MAKVVTTLQNAKKFAHFISNDFMEVMILISNFEFTLQISKNVSQVSTYIQWGKCVMVAVFVYTYTFVCVCDTVFLYSA